MCKIDWAALGVWLQFGLQLVVVVLTFPYVKRQFDEARKARELNATREIINEIGTEETRQLRYWLLHEVKEPLTPDSDVDLVKKAKRLAVAYDRVGYMVNQHLVPDIALFRFQGDEIKLVWDKVRQLVMAERTIREHYCQNFQALAEDWLPSMANRDEFSGPVHMR